jgi:hypothetical protein
MGSTSVRIGGALRHTKGCRDVSTGCSALPQCLTRLATGRHIPDPWSRPPSRRLKVHCPFKNITFSGLFSRPKSRSAECFQMLGFTICDTSSLNSTDHSSKALQNDNFGMWSKPPKSVKTREKSGKTIVHISKLCSLLSRGPFHVCSLGNREIVL